MNPKKPPLNWNPIAIHSPYALALHQAQKRWFMAGVILFAMGGLYLYQWQKFTQAQDELGPVVMTKTAIGSPQVLTADDVHLVQVPAKWRPEKALTTLESAIGETMLQPVGSQAMLSQFDIAPLQNPDSVSARFKSDWAFTIDQRWLLAAWPDLAAGDQVSVLVANPSQESDNTQIIAHNLRVISVLETGPQKLLVLNVNPEQTQALLGARALRLPMQIVVHSATNQISNTSIHEN